MVQEGEKDPHDSPIKLLVKKDTKITAGESKKIKLFFGPIKPEKTSYFHPRQIMEGKVISWDMICVPEDTNIWATNASGEDLVIRKGTALGHIPLPGRI